MPIFVGDVVKFGGRKGKLFLCVRWTESSAKVIEVSSSDVKDSSVIFSEEVRGENWSSGTMVHPRDKSADSFCALITVLSPTRIKLRPSQFKERTNKIVGIDYLPIPGQNKKGKIKGRPAVAKTVIEDHDDYFPGILPLLLHGARLFCGIIHSTR